MSGVALVTGGHRGIGLAIAKALLAEGFAVAVASEVAKNDPAVTAVREAGGRYYQHDLREIDRVPALLNAIEADLGTVSLLVNNAGIGAPVRGDLLELDPQNWDTVLSVNLSGGFFLSQAVAKRMLKTEPEGYRAILFVTSVSAAMASIERAEYCVSKAGAAMVAQLFALRLAPHGIGVFELRPGIIATDMTAGVADAYTQRIEDGLVPARRWGQPEDIGQIAAALAKGDMAFATGAVIPVDGGLSLGRL